MSGDRIEPELDDMVERSYGYRFLSDASYAGDLIAGLLMTGAVEPPTRPGTSPELDPARILTEAQEQLRRRLEQISPGTGGYFVGMWQAVVERDRRVSPVNDAFNNAREMLSVLSEVLMTVATARAEQTGTRFPPFLTEGRPSKAWNISVLRQQLGLDPDAAEEWLAFEPHAFTHRRGLRAPRTMTEEMVDGAHAAERVVRALVDIYERHLEVVFAEVDRMHAAEANRRDAQRLAHLVAPENEVVRLFFDRLDDPAWWRPLCAAHFFDDPPSPATPYVHPRWPQSRYLARVASTVVDPADFADLVCRIGERTSNVRVHEDLLRAASKLPGKHAARVLQAELSWPATLLHERVARLVGESEIVRYPAWLAGLQLHVATDSDSPYDARQKAHRELRAFLHVSAVEDEHDAAFEADEMDDAAVEHVLRHLRAHGTAEGKDTVARLLMDDVEELSAVLVREMPTTADDSDELAASDPAIPALLAWFVGSTNATARARTSDRSHLVLRSWLEHVPSRDEEALAGLMTGSSELLADAVVGGRGSPRPAAGEGDRTHVGLWDRARLAALILAEDPPLVLVEELLTDRDLARTAVVREEYTMLLQRTWTRLDAQGRRRIVDALGATGTAVASGTDASDAVARLIAGAPLVGLSPDLPDEAAFGREARAVTEHARLFLSFAQGRPDPYTEDDEPVREDRRQAEDGSMMRTATCPRRVRDGAASMARAEELRGGLDDPSPSEWAEVIEALVPHGVRVRRHASLTDAVRARWMDVAAGWLWRGAWPAPRLRDRLVKLVLQRDSRWAAAGRTHVDDQIGHDGLKAAESSPHAQALLIKLALLAGAEDGLTTHQRRRVLASLGDDLASDSPMRPMLLTVLGLLLPVVYAGAPDAWADLVRPLLRELPEMPDSDPGTLSAPALSPRAADLAALYSGLTMGRQPESPAFVREVRPFLVWAYTNLPVLRIPGDLVPSPFVMHAFALLLGELADEQAPGEVLELVLDAAPPLLAIGALRRFADLRVAGPSAGASELLPRVWASLRRWSEQHPERGGDVLAVIGTWAAKPELVEALGPAWTLSELSDVVRAHRAVDVPGELISSLATLVERSPTYAEPVAETVLLLRNTGLLRRPHRFELARLVEVLAAVATPPALLPALRAGLVADRMIGPLSTDAPFTD